MITELENIETLLEKLADIDRQCVSHQNYFDDNDDLNFDYVAWREKQAVLFAEHRSVRSKVEALGGNWRDSRK